MTEPTALTQSPFGTDHEQVVFCHDPETGLKAIIAIYSTALGPALGGTRFYPYGSESAALDDVLKLSEAMAYKAALAGLDLGGGKAVIIGDSAKVKSDDLLRAYGRFVQSLSGRYYTASDVGTSSVDMDIIAEVSRFVTGRTVEHGGAGDSSLLTALGVYQGMRACAQHLWGDTSLKGKRIGVAGTGKVGRQLISYLAEEDAEITVTDISVDARANVVAAHPGVRVVQDTAALVAQPLDIYAPCALGGVIDKAVVEALSAQIICGAANNQLAVPGVEKLLEEKVITYAPDYLVNAGGLIQVAAELDGFDFDRAALRVTGIFDTTLDVLRTAAADGVPPSVAADRLAERRMRASARPKQIWLPDA